MFVPAFVSGLLLGAFVPAYREPAIRFLYKQIEILQRVLSDHGVSTVVCKPDERVALLSIGKEMKHHVRAIFLINTWHTYRRWLLEEKAGRQPMRADRPPKFTLDEVSLVVRIAKETFDDHTQITNRNTSVSSFDQKLMLWLTVHDDFVELEKVRCC